MDHGYTAKIDFVPKPLSAPNRQKDVSGRYVLFWTKTVPARKTFHFITDLGTPFIAPTRYLRLLILKSCRGLPLNSLILHLYSCYQAGRLCPFILVKIMRKIKMITLT